jgi:hypothetical protein
VYEIVSIETVYKHKLSQVAGRDRGQNQSQVWAVRHTWTPRISTQMPGPGFYLRSPCLGAAVVDHLR